MMLPTLLLVRAGSHRKLWIPLPVFLLWPAWLLAWLAWVPARALGRDSAHKVGLILLFMSQMSGLRVDVESRRGTPVHVRFI